MRTLNPNTLCKMEKYIKEYQAENGRSPSYRNIMHGIGMSSLNLVQRYVLALEKEGRIQRTRLGNIELPLIGTIACGEPCLEIEHIEDSFELPRSLFGSGKLFTLYARGNSMVEAGINDGDLIVLRKQDYADDGEIVVAMINGETTLKRIFRRNGKVILHPENKEMKDIVVKDCEIQGVLVSCIKIYD